MARSWLIGSDPACDLVAARPSVSGHHCRLTQAGDGYLLEDLGSTNGTFVNGTRIASPTRVTPGDAITLGVAVPMPWPEPAGERIALIGRDPDNDIVLDQPVISGRHARIVWDDGQATIEDLGSTNGTFLNAPEHKIKLAPLSAGDTVLFGTFAVPAAKLLADAGLPGALPLLLRGSAMVVGRDSGCDQVLDFPMVSGRHARLSRSGDTFVIEDLGSSNGTFVGGEQIHGPTPVRPGDRIGLGSLMLTFSAEPAPRESEPGEAVPQIQVVPSAERARGPEDLAIPAVLVVQAPILAALVLLAHSRAGENSVAASSFALGLAAIWCGVADAILGTMAGRMRSPRGSVVGPTAPADVARNYAVPVALGLIQCALLLGIVHLGARLNGPWLPMYGLLVLAASVGIALGVIVSTVTRSPKKSLAIMVLAMLPMATLGGAVRPFGRMSAIEKYASSVTPSRWAFEGLLLLEVESRPVDRPADASATPTATTPSPARDRAEDYFPSETERMGVRAAAMALVALLLGLVGLTFAIPWDTFIGSAVRAAPRDADPAKPVANQAY
jgi:pSer/pThr/pTyr-binding forkhead associated (FHA) protein